MYKLVNHGKSKYYTANIEEFTGSLIDVFDEDNFKKCTIDLYIPSKYFANLVRYLLLFFYQTNVFYFFFMKFKGKYSVNRIH